MDMIKRAELLEKLKQPLPESKVNLEVLKFPVIEGSKSLPVSVEIADIENEIDVLKLNITVNL